MSTDCPWGEGSTVDNFVIIACILKVTSRTDSEAELPTFRSDAAIRGPGEGGSRAERSWDGFRRFDIDAFDHQVITARF